MSRGQQKCLRRKRPRRLYNMNKKIALVTLIEASILLSSDDKLALIDAVPGFNEKQVMALGKMLAEERAVLLANEEMIMQTIKTKLDAISAEGQSNTVYIGTGKPS